MKHYLLAAGAIAAVVAATPAAARDGQPYFGIEAGRTFMESGDFDLEFDDGTDVETFDDAINLELKSGLDADIIGGYDFGMFRLEGELALKRIRVNGVDLSNDLFGEDIDVDSRRESIVSAMVNGLVDFGFSSGVNFYAGAGLGRARVNLFDEKDSDWAGQLIAGVRVPVSEVIELGLKYRFFRTARLNFEQEEDDVTVSADGRFSSHSLLASAIFNFGEPPVVEAPVVVETPPPAAAPATQTCPDGTVILATDAGPGPPPPPPAPPGERG